LFITTCIEKQCTWPLNGKHNDVALALDLICLLQAKD